MNSKDLLIGVIIVLILSCAIAYIIIEKKNGAKCVGCPHAKSCGKKSCNNKKSI